MRCSVLVLLTFSLALFGAEPELKPAFPNYAMQVQTLPQARGNNGAERAASRLADTEIPFSWAQTVVLHEGTTSIRVLGGFDPELQPVQFAILPKEPTFVNVDLGQGTQGLLQVTARANTGGNTELFQFQVQSRGITSTEFYNLTYDIRAINTRVRGTPTMRRSAGTFIKPGNIVRYSWTQTGQGEKFPKVEAEVFGRTSVAKGIYSSTITQVLGVKYQPMVIGHFLCTVTPRDVRGEPPRGSTSNGDVFQCAFGSENLPPVTDGLTADTFTPAVGQVVTMSPIAVDPETAQSTFDNETWDFGDGTTATGISGATTHAWALPGIYRVKCTVADSAGLTATAEDDIIVGAQVLPKMTFRFFKYIIPEEGGSGLPNLDNLDATFKSAIARPGDKVVFTYNRNRFDRLNPGSNETDIILKPGGVSGATALATNFSASASSNSVTISVQKAQFDRTGDPRFGRAEFKGVFKNQRIALAVIPADGSTPRVYAYLGNMQIKVKGGVTEKNGFIPEDSVNGSATTNEPNPKKQEIY